jgi:hypothetical protein
MEVKSMTKIILFVVTIASLVLTTLALTVWFDWLDKHNWVPTFLLTVVLAASTLIYTFLTNHLAQSSQKQTDTTREQLNLEKTPNLIFSNISITPSGQTLADSNKINLQLSLFNLGRFPARLSQIVLYDENERIFVNQKVNLLIAEAQEFKEPVLLKTIYNNGENLVPEVLRKAAAVKIYYQYGATGVKIHSVSICRLANSATIEGQVQNAYMVNQEKVQFDEHNVSYFSNEDSAPPEISTWDRLASRS